MGLISAQDLLFDPSSQNLTLITDLSSTPDDRYKSFRQIVEENGFIYEEYDVTTEDGYILGLHRILSPHNPNNGPPVLLMHGVEDSSIGWILNSVDRAPGFTLVRNHFDVWLGNNRGNEYSRRHVNLTKHQKEFWHFDWEEMGLYDVPAMTDFILEKTGYDQLAAYIGHSEGTT